jgi:ABC-type transport system substrate-binding protein
VKRRQAIVGGLTLFAAACAPTRTPSPAVANETPRYGGTLNLGIDFSPTGSSSLILDPINAIAVGGGADIYEALYRPKPTGGVDPWLAEKTDISTDGLTWTLTLGSGVKFHDGTTFDSAAVKTNIEIRQNHKTFSLRGPIAAIKEVRVVNSGTVQFLLSQPTPALQSILSADAFGIVSPTALAKYPDVAKYAPNAAGTGPFKLQGAPTDVSVSLVRNEQYWGPKPYLDNVVLRAIPDASARIAALEAGDIDAVPTVPGPDYVRLLKEGRVTVYTSATAELPEYLVFNAARAPFADKRVRQAIAYGLNTQSYLSTQYGLGEIADSVVAPNLAGYAKSTPYPYDLAKAKQLLADAGVKPGTPVELPVNVLSNNAADVAQLVKQDLDQLGFKTQLRVLDVNGWYQLVSAAGADSKWDMMMTAIGVAYRDADAPLTRQFLSTNDAPKGANWAHYKNAQVDSLLLQQAATVDPIARGRLLVQLQQILWDDVPWYPLLRSRNAQASSKFVRGIEFDGNRTFLSRTWLAK